MKACQRVSSNGVQLAYEEQGAGEPAFLFVHGWTCDRTFFAPQAEHFARAHRAISVDLRGHGESDKPEGEYPIAAYASDLAAFLQATQPREGGRRGTQHGRAGRRCSWQPITRTWLPRSAMVDPAPLSIACGRRRDSWKAL
ncbi:MAG: alpha/beta fold hydrolase [Dehalococcoidia bacterium]|nr:alpha/beta fold hydrolase [Dehalococcoidia bacterium]